MNKRNINGVLLLDKPSGISSNGALQRVKHLFHATKAGHTGSLDPLATGMLPICFGAATKFSHCGLNADKIYAVTAHLGVRTTTSDAEGEVVATRPVPAYSKADIESVLNHFRGSLMQVPSMYSALKHEGQPLYKLARKGLTVERPSRAIEVYQLDLVDYQTPMLALQIHCSKGTYVRTIIDDLGEALGCGAHVVTLRRLAVSTFCGHSMYPWSQLEAEYRADDVAALDHYLLPLSVFK